MLDLSSEIMRDAKQRKFKTFPRLLEEHIAFNLAGQAVVSRLLKVSVERISVCPILLAGSIEHVRYNDTPIGAVLQTELEWRERQAPDTIFDESFFIPRAQAFEAHIAVRLAGAATERLFCDGHARFKTNAYNRDITRLIRFCWCERKQLKYSAISLVRQNGHAVLEIAGRLASRTTLSGDELNRIIDPLLFDA